MNRILSRLLSSSSFLVSFPLLKQACPWRSTTSRTSDDSRSHSTTSCHRSRPRNKCFRPSAPPDGTTSNTLRFRHISIQNRACISLTFRLTSSGWAAVSCSLRRDRILAHNRFGWRRFHKRKGNATGGDSIVTNGRERVSTTAEIMTARSCRDAVESRPDLITDQNLKLN